MSRYFVSAVVAAAAALGHADRAAADWCQEARVTGYSRVEHGTHTFDGTPIWTPEPIAAASWNIPIDAQVWVEGLGTYRVADRGSGLGSAGWIDIAVWTRAEAFELTSWRTICVMIPPTIAPSAGGTTAPP